MLNKAGITKVGLTIRSYPPLDLQHIYHTKIKLIKLDDTFSLKIRMVRRSDHRCTSNLLKS